MQQRTSSRFGYICECADTKCRRKIHIAKEEWAKLASVGRVVHRDHHYKAKLVIGEGMAVGRKIKLPEYLEEESLVARIEREMGLSWH